GTYPLASLLNHACLPNCVAMFAPGGQLLAVALEDIAPGQEITISYVDAISPYESRRTALRRKYHFTCQCPR
ncbi:hypothetical protein BJ085DRAFT_5041, partial [Dimargaris cristalligena]